MPPPEHNPYASPTAPQMGEGLGDDFGALRSKTIRGWQVSLLILLLPAMVNFYLLLERSIRYVDVVPPQPHFALILVNMIWCVPLAALLRFAFLPLLELIAGAIRYLFARNVPRQLWLASMYRSLSLLVPVAIFGAVLWMVWLVGFYLLEMNFFVISIPVGILAHLLGATIYLRIFYGWFRLSRESPTQP